MERLNMGNILSCVLEVVIGILLLIDPVSFTASIIMVLGAVLAVMGVAAIIGYFRMDAEEAAQTNGLLKGLLLLGCAFICLFRSKWLIGAIPLITVFYGILILVIGIAKLQDTVNMLRLKKQYWYMPLIGAVLSIPFAIVTLINPFISTALLGIFIAVSLIVEAAVDILTFIFWRK